MTNATGVHELHEYPAAFGVHGIGNISPTRCLLVGETAGNT
jgi:hypothetical protein